MQRQRQQRNPTAASPPAHLQTIHYHNYNNKINDDDIDNNKNPTAASPPAHLQMMHCHNYNNSNKINDNDVDNKGIRQLQATPAHLQTMHCHNYNNSNKINDNDNKGIPQLQTHQHICRWCTTTATTTATKSTTTITTTKKSHSCKPTSTLADDALPQLQQQQKQRQRQQRNPIAASPPAHLQTMHCRSSMVRQLLGQLVGNTPQPLVLPVPPLVTVCVGDVVAAVVVGVGVGVVVAWDVGCVVDDSLGAQLPSGIRQNEQKECGKVNWESRLYVSEC